MSLHGDYEDGNVFARILRGELPATKVHEDDRTLAFLDVAPQSRGHTLVVSKASRARTILDIEPDALAEVMAATQRIARAIDAALQPDGIRIIQFNGTPAGQTVFHLHVHIIPVWEGVALAPHAGGGTTGGEDPKALAALIAARL